MIGNSKWTVRSWRASGINNALKPRISNTLTMLVPGDVADRQRSAALPGGDHADGELGHAGADRHHRQPDDDRADAQPGGQLRPTTHHHLGSDDQRRQSDHEPHEVRRHRRLSNAKKPPPERGLFR
jgi:hypothetical protein